ncbi:23S rRNA (guanosine(2251)-2'-O)-methyltransferase RlmB [Mycoplasmopsis gallopavonis]|uniref:rRNA methylase n=1 Tax=Mycoplasmopsis gallopavonis TaxID=76629 RepID=A0A449AZ82_9BACT|nr:23S rRNA (guanosine(2251)-2'-O)-methyltransferase RlmB [Mycoplasmopsis gallopavonis]RIV16954.1 23S rRNA (guanosine(2251)-2'-O)-methyltransferase RlmB [Mycoplasmopsis gallopavonis]VEU72797.1 rRNA methylase [Mycoplasmopsis gallopavonis]
MKQLIMCGKNSVLEAIKSKLQIQLIYLSKKENIKLIPKEYKIEIKDQSFMDQLTKENHQGFIALIEPIQFKDINYLISKKPQTTLLLDHIQDPHNLGAIIRTANAAGIKDLILPKENAASINETVLKIASGGIVGMNIYRVNSLSATISKLQKNGFWAYATVLDEKALPHTQVSYNDPSIIIVGNEGTGVSKSVLSVVDQTVYIKQYGNVQSLNVSVATGIILFDLVSRNESE